MAVIEYETAVAALNSVSMFNQQMLMDRTMTVRFDGKPGASGGRDEPAAKLPSGLKSIGKSILPAVAHSDAVKVLQNPIGQLLGGLGMNLNGTAPRLMSKSRLFDGVRVLRDAHY